MELQEAIKSFGARIKTLQSTIETEEATKTSLVMPFFQMLGYDIFNPAEFTPEFTADVGIKKGEKVDYAIIIDNEPVILIECKALNESLEKHDSQLFRYFGTTSAKFAILTNGRFYRFYTDIAEPNKMDDSPFLEIDLLNIKDHLLPELTKFTKENFDEEAIFNTASELKYMAQLRMLINEEIANPSDDFVRLLLSRGIYDGVKTQNIVEKYQGLTKKAFSLVISERINDRLKSALSSDEDQQHEQSQDTQEDVQEEPKIITTQEELDAYYITKAILRNIVDANRITYKDTESYFAIQLDNRTTKWIARIYIKDRVKYLVIQGDGGEHVRYDIESVDDIYALSDKLEARLNALL